MRLYKQASISKATNKQPANSKWAGSFHGNALVLVNDRHPQPREMKHYYDDNHGKKKGSSTWAGSFNGNGMVYAKQQNDQKERNLKLDYAYRTKSKDSAETNWKKSFGGNSMVLAGRDRQAQPFMLPDKADNKEDSGPWASGFSSSSMVLANSQLRPQRETRLKIAEKRQGNRFQLDDHRRWRLGFENVGQCCFQKYCRCRFSTK